AEAVCFRCMNDGLGHKLNELAETRDEIDAELSVARERLQHAQTALYDEEDTVTEYTEKLAAFDAMIEAKR
ncbi:MAG: hypothetical protein NUW01_18455, partial [Gemmatimonadaceae bacterium]|nr:hypothetical protein [Gemmatimonadaceae bacterium]